MADHSVLRLTDLPVEVLSIIFSMVCSADKVNLARVCQRFNAVLQRRELIWSVDFQRAYEVNTNLAYSFLKDKTRCNFITSVNLTSCYWLSSTTIRQFLTGLKNLETMLVAETKLRNSDLKYLLSKLLKVKNLAISWKGPVDIGPKVKDLRSIYVYVSAERKSECTQICRFLISCEMIEKIAIVTEISLNHENFEYSKLCLSERGKLPHLRSFIVTAVKGVVEDSCKSFPVEGYVSLFEEKSELWPDWEVSSIPQDLESTYPLQAFVSFIKRNFESNGSIMDRACIAYIRCTQIGESLLNESVFQSLLKLRSLSVHCRQEDIDVAIPSMFHEECQLEELNIYGWHSKMVLHICKAMPFSLSSVRLRKLCIPVCAIWRKKTPQPTTSNAGFQSRCERPRVSHLTANESLEDSPFLNLVQSCPNIEEFCMDYRRDSAACVFLVGILPRNGSMLPIPCECEWDSQQLIHIANWKKLRELTLGSIMITSFNFLEKIGRCCQMFTSLTLNYMHLTASAVGMAGLVKALPLFTKLKDLTIRQQRGPSVLHALNQKTLLRVVLDCDQISGRECSQFLENCTKVVFLYIVCDISKAEIRRIKTLIQKRFAQRQALTFHIAEAFVGQRNSLGGASYRQTIISYYARTFPGIHPNEILHREVSLGVPEDLNSLPTSEENRLELETLGEVPLLKALRRSSQESLKVVSVFRKDIFCYKRVTGEDFESKIELPVILKSLLNVNS